MKYLFVLLITCSIYGQGIPVIGDTTDLKDYSDKQIVILEKFGGTDQTGGGLFRRVDSAYTEGTHAFDYTALDGLQWVRMQWIGGELSAFDALTAVDITTTDDLVIGDDSDLGGDVTLENDEIIINATDGDVEFVFNDDDDSLGQVIIKSSLTGTSLEDNNHLDITFEANDGGSAVAEYAKIIVTITDTASASEDATFKFQTMSGGTSTLGLTLTGANAQVAGTLGATGVATFTAGYLSTEQTLQCTDAVVADTNVITAGITHVTVSATNQDANDFIVLPAIGDVPIGHTIVIVANSTTNFELRTVAASNVKINNVDADGTNEYLVTDANTVFIHKVTDAYGWVAYDFDHVGAIVAAHVPN